MPTPKQATLIQKDKNITIHKMSPASAPVTNGRNSLSEDPVSTTPSSIVREDEHRMISSPTELLENGHWKNLERSGKEASNRGGSLANQKRKRVRIDSNEDEENTNGDTRKEKRNDPDYIYGQSMAKKKPMKKVPSSSQFVDSANESNLDQDEAESSENGVNQNGQDESQHMENSQPRGVIYTNKS
jgi:hypothetical protein